MPDPYVLGEQARADLDSIIVYVAEQSGSIETAFRVDEKLHDAFRFLAENPRAGHTRTDILAH
jgi:plasmid stabilization system protein ParE